MDRREFLRTGRRALSCRCCPPIQPKHWCCSLHRRAGDAELNARVRAHLPGAGTDVPNYATFLGLDKGELAPLRSKLDTRPVALARREEAARTDKFIGWLEAVPEAGLSDSAKLNREVVICGTSEPAMSARSSSTFQSAEPLSGQPAGRLLFFDPGLPPQRAYDRERRRCARPICLASRNSRPSSTMRRPKRAGRRHAASLRRAGRWTLR